MVATCTDNALVVEGDDDGDVTVEGSLRGCLSPLNGDIRSATVSGSGHVLVESGVLLVVRTTDTIEWNTGAVTTETVTRTFTGASTIVATGTGATLSGLFHPSAEAEEGAGTRTNPAAVRSADHIEWHVEMGMVVQLIESP